MEVMFYMMFFLVMSVFIVTFVRMIGEWIKNSNSPRLTVDATVVAKRDQMHRHTSSNGHSHRSYSYHVTFQFDSGDRLELRVPSHEFGLLVEGDTGKLTFQGTRYLSFDRKF
jgi:hypothetical protein